MNSRIGISNAPGLQSISRTFTKKQNDAAVLGDRLGDLDYFINDVLSLDDGSSDKNPLPGEVDFRGQKEIRTPYSAASKMTQAELIAGPDGQRLTHYTISAPTNISNTHEPEPKEDHVIGVRNVYELNEKTGLISHSRTRFEHPLNRDFEEVWDPSYKCYQEFEKDPWVSTNSGPLIDEQRMVLDPNRGVITYLD